MLKNQYISLKLMLATLMLSLSIFSCEKALEVPYPEHKKRIVANAFLNPGTPLDVYLSRSYGPLEDLSKTDLLVKDATVEVWEGGQLAGTLSYQDTTIQDTLFTGAVETRILGKYHNPSLLVEAGKTYELKAKHSTFDDISARTLVPSELEITQVLLKQNVHRTNIEGSSESQSLLNIQLKDPVGEKNYYQIRMEIDVTDPDFPGETFRTQAYVSGPEAGRDVNGAYKTTSMWLEDGNLDGQTVSKDFVVILPNAYEPASELKDLTISNIYLTIYSASEDSYQYLEKLQKQEQGSGGFDLFPPEAIVVYSNIEGGFGIFGGLSIKHQVFPQ